MEIGAIARASERAADAARRAEQLDVRIARLRSGVSLTPEDVLFGRQAAERAVGRALRAERDLRRAHESARTAYKAAGAREAAVASLCRAAGAPTAADVHERMAAEYDLLAAVTHVALWSTQDPPVAVPATEAVVSWPAGAATQASPIWTRQLVVEDMPGLSGLRHELQELLQEAGVDTAVVDEMALAVEEVASNGIRHGTPPVQVAVSHRPPHLECAVIDHGRGFDWASVTDRPADDPLGEGRFGLRLAQALCDELTTRSAPEGFVVRMVKRL